MISTKFLTFFLIAYIIFPLRANPVTKELKKKPRQRGGKDGSCTREECMEGLKSFKVTGDCKRAPFCINQVVRTLKKVDKEKVALQKKYEKEMEELNLLKENNENLTEMRTNNENEWEEKYRILTDDFELLRSSEALLRQTNLGMEAANTALEKRNQKLQDKFQDLKKKLELIEKHSASIITVNAEKEDLTNALNEMKKKHQIQEKRILDIVKSLELIETQNALNSQNLSDVTKENLELKSALQVSKSQLDHLRLQEEKLKTTKQDYQSCQESKSKLETANNNCIATEKEMNVCKAELTKLSSLLEEKLQLVQESQKSEKNVKKKNSQLKEDLKKAKSELNSFTSNLEKKARVVEDLQTKLSNCQTEQTERGDRKQEKNCESPCTISKNTVNDFIQNGEKDENLKTENEILSKQVENLEQSLKQCQNISEVTADPDVNEDASKTIIKDLLS